MIEGRTDRNGKFQFRWKEINGPAVVAPTRTGFGSTILLKVATQLGKNVKIDFEPDGLIYQLQSDFSAIIMAGEKESVRNLVPVSAEPAPNGI